MPCSTHRSKEEKSIGRGNQKASLEGKEEHRAMESKSIARRKGRVSGEGIKKHRSKERKSIFLLIQASITLSPKYSLNFEHLRLSRSTSPSYHVQSWTTILLCDHGEGISGVLITFPKTLPCSCTFSSRTGTTLPTRCAAPLH